MMDHDVYDVEAYVLGSLDRQETLAFEAHLSSCAQCQRDVASYIPVLQGLRTLSPPSPPPLPKPARRAWALPRSFQVAAAIVVFALGAVGGVRYQQVQSNDMVAVAAMSATSSKEVRLEGIHTEGRAIVGMGRQRTGFVLVGLPPLPTGAVYEVWVGGNGTGRAGTLRRTADGYEVLVVQGDLLDGAQNVTVKTGNQTVATGAV